MLFEDVCKVDKYVYLLPNIKINWIILKNKAETTSFMLPLFQTNVCRLVNVLCHQAPIL